MSKNKGMVIVSKEEAYWISIKGNAVIELRRMKETKEHNKKVEEDLDKQIKFNNAILEMAESKILEQKNAS